MELIATCKYKSDGWPVTRLLFKFGDDQYEEVVFAGIYLRTDKGSCLMGVYVDAQAMLEDMEYVAPTQNG